MDSYLHILCVCIFEDKDKLNLQFSRTGAQLQSYNKLRAEQADDDHLTTYTGV